MPNKFSSKPLKKVSSNSEMKLYVRVTILGLAIFLGLFTYTSWLKIPGVLNKSVADTATILIGLSMLLSALCYFWNFFDSKIIYRKHLGLIGFAFAVVHLILSWSAMMDFIQVETWKENAVWAPLTGTVALLIFTIMSLISNRFSALKLGGNNWKLILRTGYFALVLVFLHVVLLKGARWVTWYEGGMKTSPSSSLLVSSFIVIVVLMRIGLWFSLKKQRRLK